MTEPGDGPGMRRAMGEAAVHAAEAVEYDSAGTVAEVSVTE